MGKRSNFQPAEPFYIKQAARAPAPRAARRLARVFLVIVGMLLVGLLVAALTSAINASTTDERALAKLDSYREQDMVNLDAYLTHRGFTAIGTSDEIVYKRYGKNVVIHDMGDYVRVGDGKGNVRDYGIPTCYYSYLDDGSVRYDSYVCRVAYLGDYGEARIGPTVSEQNLRDLSIPREALAEIVRITYR